MFGEPIKLAIIEDDPAEAARMREELEKCEAVREGRVQIVTLGAAGAGGISRDSVQLTGMLTHRSMSQLLKEHVIDFPCETPEHSPERLRGNGQRKLLTNAAGTMTWPAAKDKRGRR